MNTLGFASILAACSIALGSPGALAQTGPPDEIQTYKLEKTARFETGCFSMCDCAIVTHPLMGTFSLQHTGFDPLYDYYAVTDVRWVVSDASTYATISGSGTYKRGGEFALVHQLVLDLSVNGEPTQHFDSGQIVGGSEWPRIVIDVSMHQNSACVDTVIHVDATDPIATGIGTSGGLSAPWVKVAPNPFRSATELRVAVPRASQVEVVVYDAGGRAVRHLRYGAMGTGVHPLAWDGRRDQGSPCASGVYFVETRVGTERITSRIVKLE